MNIAVSTHDNSLSVAKNSRNLEASRTLNVHEKGVGRLYKSLELVCTGLNFRRRVQQIVGHFGNFFSSEQNNFFIR